MKTEYITSNSGRYKYKLTPTELIELDKQQGYTAQRTMFAIAGPPLWDSQLRFVVFSNRSGRQFDFTYYYYKDSRGCLNIGCRRFNKTTTKKLLKWAGLQ